MSLRYDETYTVELHDKVEVRVAGGVHEGVVKRLHPRSDEVTVTYEDCHEAYRASGNPVVRSVRISVSSVDLIQRDG